MSDSSDIEMQSAPALLIKKNKKPKPPKSPSEEILAPGPKKVPTKVMIHEALLDLRKGTRKGSSLHAIKKHMAEKHGVDIEKINYIIKKLIKEGVESGAILQTKGIGASGSFRLATNKTEEKKKAKPKKKDNPEKKSEESKKISEKSEGKPKKKAIVKENSQEEAKKVLKKKTDIAKTTKGAAKEKNNKKEGKVEKTKKKMATDKSTPAKKKMTISKRKSVGSIIKAPKMRPKMKS